MNKTIFLDMDSVIADFDTAYRSMSFEEELVDSKKFHRAVTERLIFKDLEKMPRADELIDFVFEEFIDFQICILSSLGTRTEHVSQQAKLQKIQWLFTNFPSVKFDSLNFVQPPATIEKAKYANKFSLLIDDRKDIVEEFVKQGGQAVMYQDSRFDVLKDEIMEKASLIRSVYNPVAA